MAFPTRRFICFACLGALLLVGGCGGDGRAATVARASPEPSPSRVGVPELRRLLMSPQRPMLIDVRPLADYEAFHIPGAIHRAVHELAHSAAVRAGDPIIVAEGHGIGRIGAVLESLRAESIDLRVLEGGMAAWCVAGGETTAPCVEAELVAPERLFEVLPCAEREVLVALAHDDALPVMSAAERLVPGRPILRWHSPGELALRAGEAIARSGRPLVVVDGDGSDIAALRASLPDSMKGSVFFVRGGLAAYGAFIARQDAIAGRETFVSLSAGDRRDAHAFVAPKKSCGCL